MVHGADQGRQRRCGPRVTLTCACRAAPYPARKVDNISQTMTFGIPHEGRCVVQGFLTKNSPRSANNFQENKLETLNLFTTTTTRHVSKPEPPHNGAGVRLLALWCVWIE